MTKPFVLLQSRPEDEASDNEYQAFLHFGGLAPGDLERVRIEAGQRPAQSLAAYSGVLMGGGPANFAYAPTEKPAEQREFEAVMMPLLREIITHDIPFLGVCLGVGALVSALGGTPSFAYGEAIGAVPITLTPAAGDDPLLAGLPTTFDGFVGHKEGVLEPPAACTVLARSRRCMQMLRVGCNVYATQFHPELDPESLALRIDIYRHAGYCAPDEADILIANARQQTVTEPVKILRRFVQRYRQ